MHPRPGIILQRIGLAAVLLVMAGCSGDNGSSPSPGPDAAALTATGWEYFETGDYEDALASFEDALAGEAAYGPALVGQGWTRLQQASNTAELEAALECFDDASAAGETGADLHAGRAVALLAQGSDPAGAATAAREAQNRAPTFAFEHWEGFDIADLHVLEALAEAGQSAWSSALDAAQPLGGSGIAAADSTTWVVGDVTYPAFAHAVLAHLMLLAEQEVEP